MGDVKIVPDRGRNSSRHQPRGCSSSRHQPRDAAHQGISPGGETHRGISSGKQLIKVSAPGGETQQATTPGEQLITLVSVDYYPVTYAQLEIVIAEGFAEHLNLFFTCAMGGTTPDNSKLFHA